MSEPETIRLAFVDTEAPPIYHRRDPATRHRSGYEPEAAELICAEAGLAVEWVEMPWSEMIPSVRSGAVDAVWCGQGVIPERSALVDFTRPYAAFRDALVLRADRAVSDPDRMSGYRFAVIEGSANLKFARTFPGVEVIEFGAAPDVLGDMAEAARSGRADGFIDDDVVMVPFAEQDPDFVLGFIGDILHPWAVGVAPGNDRLRQRLDAAIDRVAADGRLKRVWSTWIPSLPFPFGAGE